MATSDHRLIFERPIYELEARLEKLERNAKENPEVAGELQRLRRERVELIRRIYSSLKPWENCEIAFSTVASAA